MICEICGTKFEKQLWGGEFSQCCSKHCFTTKFWDGICKEKEEHVVINGVCYAVEDDPVNGFLGYSGRKFKIKMFDTGEVIETNNLWCQGDVPEEYKSRLPNTAEFVR